MSTTTIIFLAIGFSGFALLVFAFVKGMKS